MPTITDSADWIPAVTEVAVTDPILGGADGVINVQAKQLADRTAYLKLAGEATADVAADASGKADTALAQIAAAEQAAGGSATNAGEALSHKNEALAAKALTELARDAAQGAQQQAGESASYTYQALQVAQQKASDASTAATVAVNGAGASISARDVAVAAKNSAEFAAASAAGVKTQVDLSAAAVSDAMNSASASALNASGSATQAAAILSSRVADTSAHVYGRPVFESLDAAAPVSLVRDVVVLKKLRTDRPEFAVYRHIEGAEWERYFFTSRFYPAYGTFPASSGPPLLVHSSLSLLFPSTPVARAADTVATGYTASTPVSTSATASSTARVGTWTASATSGGVTDVRYSVVTGDYVEYTVTVPANGRLLLRAYMNATNGGVASILVTAGGTEIPAGKYSCKPSKLISLAAQTGPGSVPLAESLDAGTYVVRLTRDVSSSASGRLYDGGIQVFNPISFSEIGSHGPCQTEDVNGASSTVFRFPGSVIVARFDNCTSLSFGYQSSTVGGVTQFTVYDAAGAVVPTDTPTIDTYSASPSDSRVTVVQGLPVGDYYLHAKVSASKNASSGDYRLYNQSGYAGNTSETGDPYTDVFDDLSFPKNPSSMDALGTHILTGPGNFEYATEWRPVGSSVGDEEFVGGVHRCETNVSISDCTFKVDGVVVNFSAGAADAVWVGASIELSFLTSLYFPSSQTVNFARLNWNLKINRAGYFPKVTRTMLIDAIAHYDYAVMLQVPNGGDSRPSSVGGGMQVMAGSRGVTRSLGLSNDYAGSEDVQSDGWVACGTQYASICKWSDASVSLSGMPAEAKIGVFGGVVRDLPAHQLKAYTSLTRNFSGVTYPAGHVTTISKRYRTIKGDWRYLAGG